MFRDALLLCCNRVTHTDSETPPGGERRWGEGRGRGGGGLLAVAAAGELKTQLRETASPSTSRNSGTSEGEAFLTRPSPARWDSFSQGSADVIERKVEGAMNHHHYHHHLQHQHLLLLGAAGSFHPPSSPCRGVKGAPRISQ